MSSFRRSEQKMAKQTIKKTNNNKLIVGGVTLAIVIALVIALVAGGSKNSSITPTSDGSVSVGENQPVEVVGDAL